MNIEHLKRHVLAGGGEWVGVQESVPPAPNLVLFNSPTTGSTLSLPDTEEFTAARVHEKILWSDASFGKSAKIRISRVQLEATIADLNEVVERLKLQLQRGE